MDDILTTAAAVNLLSRAAVRHRLSSGQWQRPARGVIATHSGSLTPDQRERVALAASPPGSALAGLTAAARQGFTGFPPDSIHVVLPPGAKRPAGDWVVHYSTMLGPKDVITHRGPAMTTLERSVIDAASWSSSPKRARAMVLAVFQQGRTNVRRMREALSRRGPCRHRALIKESILDAVGGIQSLPERDFDQARIAAGLPTPTRQTRVKTKDGRYYLDVWWEQFNLAIEIHGLPHLAVEQWSDDLHRTNELVIDGRRVLVFSSYAVRHEIDTVVDQVLRAITGSAPGGDGSLAKDAALATLRSKDPSHPACATSKDPSECER